MNGEARLQPGDVIDLGNDGECMVFMVNFSRAAVVPLQSNVVRMVTRFGKAVEFTAESGIINISPNSQCPIIERRGQQGLKDWITQTKRDKPRGHDLLGHSVRGVLLAMGKSGWTLQDAEAAVKAAGFELASSTIRRRLRAGKSGKKTAPDISEKDLESLRPTKEKSVKRRIFN